MQCDTAIFYHILVCIGEWMLYRTQCWRALWDGDKPKPLQYTDTNGDSTGRNSLCDLGCAYWPSGDKIGCKSLGSDTSSVHFVNYADADLLSTYTTTNGFALLKTTVPGVVYSVELVCVSCGAAEELDLYLPAQSGADNHTGNAGNKWAYEYSDNSWYLRFRFSRLLNSNPKLGFQKDTPNQVESPPGI